MDEFDKIAESLAADPAIKDALAEHAAACADDEATCVVCNTKSALAQLTFVHQALQHESCDDPECEQISELDIAGSMIDSLESALHLISACQAAIKLLAEISHAAAFVIYQEEVAEDDDEEE